MDDTAIIRSNINCDGGCTGIEDRQGGRKIRALKAYSTSQENWSSRARSFEVPIYGHNHNHLQHIKINIISLMISSKSTHFSFHVRSQRSSARRTRFSSGGSIAGSYPTATKQRIRFSQESEREKMMTVDEKDEPVTFCLISAAVGWSALSNS